MTPHALIANLRAYHTALAWARDIKDGMMMSGPQIKSWWTMSVEHCRWVNQQLEEEASHRNKIFIPFERSHVSFLRSFTPQSMERRQAHTFFKSVSFYIPLFLSPSVQLKQTPSLPGARFAYGIFASAPLEDVGDKLSSVRGQLCQISEEEYDMLMTSHANHSLLVMNKVDVPHITTKGLVTPKDDRAQRLQMRERRKTKVVQPKAVTVTPRPHTVRRVYHFIVAGGLSFLNNACGAHSNLHPCAWKTDSDTGDGQYQVVTLKRDVRAGEELLISYSGNGTSSDDCPCLLCIHRIEIDHKASKKP